jgi:mono/diheme cytochrome c family protein
MKKILKWIGIVLGGLIGLIALVVVVLYFVGNARISRAYDIQPETVIVPTDAEAIERGRHLAEIMGCTDCHGENLGGAEFFNDPAIAVSYAPNLTSGKGGAGAEFTDADWILAIRHGIDPHQGRALLVMPAEDYRHLSAEDLGAVIAYVKSVPPVDSETPEPTYGFMGRVLIAAGAFGQPFPAEYIDHSSPLQAAPMPDATVEYGDYLVRITGCRTCHGQELAGGPHPEPGAPPGPNLTPGGSLSGWSEQTFLGAIRTRQSEWMPFESLSQMTDDELKAIWLYLQSLPAREKAIR